MSAASADIGGSDLFSASSKGGYFDWRMSGTHIVEAVMKVLVSAKLLLVIASFAAWSNPATAQNVVGLRVQTGNGLGPPASQLPGKLSRKSQQLSGQFQSVCLTDFGPTCDVTSGRPILPGAICHCGPNIGTTLSP